MKLDPNLVARGWIDIQPLDVESEAYGQGSWAFDMMLDVVENDWPYAWEIIVEIVTIDSSGEYSIPLGIGPLSEIFHAFGDEVIESAEKLAPQSIPFKQALREIQKEYVSEEVWRRIQIACSP